MPTNSLAPKTVAILRHRIRDDGIEPGLLEKDEANAYRVLDAICTIHAEGGVATRELITELTGLKPTTVDDRIKALRGERLISAEKQNYSPLQQYARTESVSLTALDDGAYKLEKGDCVMLLNPIEARKAGQMLIGTSVNQNDRNRIFELEAMVLEMSRIIREQDLLAKALADARERDKNMAQLNLLAS